MRHRSGIHRRPESATSAAHSHELPYKITPLVASSYPLLRTPLSTSALPLSAPPHHRGKRSPPSCSILPCSRTIVFFALLNTCFCHCRAHPRLSRPRTREADEPRSQERFLARPRTVPRTARTTRNGAACKTRGFAAASTDHRASRVQAGAAPATARDDGWRAALVGAGSQLCEHRTPQLTCRSRVQL